MKKLIMFFLLIYAVEFSIVFLVVKIAGLSVISLIISALLCLIMPFPMTDAMIENIEKEDK